MPSKCSHPLNLSLWREVDSEDGSLLAVGQLVGSQQPSKMLSALDSFISVDGIPRN